MRFFDRSLEQLANRDTRPLLHRDKVPGPTRSGIIGIDRKTPQLLAIVVVFNRRDCQRLHPPRVLQHEHHRDLAQTWRHASTVSEAATLARVPRASPAAASGVSAALSLALSAFASKPFFLHRAGTVETDLLLPRLLQADDSLLLEVGKARSKDT